MSLANLSHRFVLIVIMENKSYILTDNKELIKIGFLSALLLQERLQVPVLQELEHHHVGILVNDDPDHLNLKKKTLFGSLMAIWFTLISNTFNFYLTSNIFQLNLEQTLEVVEDFHHLQY